MNSQNDNSRPLRILSAGDLYHINESVTGHSPFVRDQQLLRSAVQRPFLILFGEEQFPTLLEKAASIMHSVAAHHLFADGNKRTAAAATALFLEANGIMPDWTTDEVTPFVLQVAKGEQDIHDIAAWLDAHTHPATSSTD